MKALNVTVSKRAQQALNRRAIRRYKQNKEYMECMKLSRTSDGFKIEEYISVPIDSSDAENVVANDTAYQAIKKHMQVDGYEFGTIHTHIVSDTSPSKYDLEDGVAEGESLFGVISIEKVRGRIITQVDFWVPQLPATIHMVKT